MASGSVPRVMMPDDWRLRETQRTAVDHNERLCASHPASLPEMASIDPNPHRHRGHSPRRLETQRHQRAGRLATGQPWAPDRRAGS